MKKSVVLFVALCMAFHAQPQTTPVKQTTHEEQLWLGYFNQTRISNRWGFWLDIHLRTTEHFATKFSKAIIRPGISFYVSDHVKLTAGYAFINHFPERGHENISQPEHRPWQQIQWHQKSGKFKFMQWVRFEQRFRRKIKNDDELAEGYNFNYRLRYNFMLMYPLGKEAFAPKTLFIALNDEIHINAGKQIVYNYFDQNRFFAGLGLQLTSHSNIQLGYMNIFQQLSSGNNYQMLHCIRLFFFQNLDLRKKKE